MTCTHSPGGFGLYEDIQTDCDGEGTALSHDPSHHSRGWDTSLPSSLNGGGGDLDKTAMTKRVRNLHKVHVTKI